MGVVWRVLAAVMVQVEHSATLNPRHRHIRRLLRRPELELPARTNREVCVKPEDPVLTSLRKKKSFARQLKQEGGTQVVRASPGNNGFGIGIRSRHSLGQRISVLCQFASTVTAAQLEELPGQHYRSAVLACWTSYGGCGAWRETATMGGSSCWQQQPRWCPGSCTLEGMQEHLSIRESIPSSCARSDRWSGRMSCCCAPRKTGMFRQWRQRLQPSEHFPTAPPTTPFSGRVRGKQSETTGSGWRSWVGVQGPE